jgi:hypothetical protein
VYMVPLRESSQRDWNMDFMLTIAYEKCLVAISGAVMIIILYPFKYWLLILTVVDLIHRSSIWKTDGAFKPTRAHPTVIGQ